MIFPQTSHFDDLQEQKGKRLPCGVFPLRSVSLAGSPFWALRGACEGGGGRAPAGQTVRRTVSTAAGPLSAPVQPERPAGRCPDFAGTRKSAPRGLPGLSQGGAQILGAYAGSNSVCRFCGSLGLFQKEARIFNAWVSRNFVYPFCGLL